jgi:hypothetical protein
VCVGLVDHGPGATHPGVRSSLVFRRCMNPYRGIAGSQNADGAVAERVILVRAGDFAEFDALETGLVADVELHPGASATH